MLKKQILTESHDNACAFPGWNLDYIQLSSGRYRCEWYGVELPGLSIYVEQGNATVHQCGFGKAGNLIFGIPLHMLEQGTFNGGDWFNGVHVFRSECAWDVVVPPMTLLMIEVDMALIREHIWHLEHLNIDDWLNGGWLHLQEPALCTPLIQEFRQIFAACLDLSLQSYSQQAQHFLQDSIFEALMPALTACAHPPRNTLGNFSRMQLIRRTRDYIFAHLDEPIRVVDICSELGVSRRTLQNGFQQALGTNPASYLRLLRLNGARKDLVAAMQPETLVQHIAAKWGFWHLSRFSSEYREMFNELPSQTLLAHT